ncbi:hypothetical protein [Marinobacter sp. F4206]|uniref:hypothetical protein n=1 Tax=Marinobacter sp. F4206 TaxID=2861777 RepID=UPI001C5D6CAF|nr:hypothetical protein [Marinobacter sp. F4206]MBW4935554.1 BatD family protein [Marinobacter sp. F4206]
MNRWPVILLMLLVKEQASAEHAPVLRTELEQTVAVPGQPISLRLTLLVPTFMPKPPVWPSFELPDLMVRLPERASGPTSDRVDGETWSGITRHYRIYPMAEGDFEIPPQPVQITFVELDNQQPTTITMSTEPLSFSGKIPEEGKALSPFLAASNITIEQQLKGDAEELKPGESLIWTVTARIEGTSPMFLPDLISDLRLEGLAVYPEDPVISETSDRGVLGGTRTEQITLVAEVGGAGELPPITLQWLDLDNQCIEIAETGPVSYAVDGPLVGTELIRNWRPIALAVIAGLFILFSMFWASRRFSGPLRQFAARRKSHYETSELHAYRVLTHAVKNRSRTRLYPALHHWLGFFPSREAEDHERLKKTLLELGRQHYGTADAKEEDLWLHLSKILREMRRHLRHRFGSYQALPPMNPTNQQ